MKRSLSLVVCAGLAATSISGQVFPGRVAGNSDLLVASDWASSLLSTSVNDHTLTIPLVASSSFVSNSVVIIDREKIKICGVSGVTLTVCSGGRGFDGSAAVSHAARAKVECNVSSPYHNALAAEVIALEQWILARSARVYELLVGGTLGIGTDLAPNLYIVSSTAHASFVSVKLKGAPVGSSVIVAIYQDNALWGTVTVPAGQTVVTLDSTQLNSLGSINQGAYWRVDITAVGSTYPGNDALVTIQG